MRPSSRKATPRSSSTHDARLVASAEILPGRQLLTFAAPGLAASVRPGQNVFVNHPRPLGMLLPAAPVAGIHRSRGLVDLYVGPPTQAMGLDAVARMHVGETAEFAGPQGHGFEIDARSRYLLVVADGMGLASVRAIVHEAIDGGRQVTVLLGASSASEVFPSTRLPDEVEYVVATTDGSLGQRGQATDLVSDYEAWADQCFAGGSAELLSRLATLARGRDARMGVARLGRRRPRKGTASTANPRRNAWLQVVMPLQEACALGVCLGCVASGAKGPLRVCREGPTFAAEELRLEPGR